MSLQEFLDAVLEHSASQRQFVPPSIALERIKMRIAPPEEENDCSAQDGGRVAETGSFGGEAMSSGGAGIAEGRQTAGALLAKRQRDKRWMHDIRCNASCGSECRLMVGGVARGFQPSNLAWVPATQSTHLLKVAARTLGLRTFSDAYIAVL